jgi:acyl carrier protein
MGRWLASGMVQIIGRADNQVKVRGFRVELGEIEAALLSNEDVKSTVVAVRPSRVDGQQRLTAYVVPVTPGGVSSRTLLAHLRDRLPDYMVPESLIFLEEIPRTAHGKVDRLALPLEKAEVSASIGSLPHLFSPLEGQLADVWRKVLQLDTVNAEDNFFDVGGHSLLLVQLQAALARDLQMTLPVLTLFQFPTIRKLAEHISLGEQNGTDLQSARLRGATRLQSLSRRHRPRMPRRDIE